MCGAEIAAAITTLVKGAGAAGAGGSAAGASATAASTAATAAGAATGSMIPTGAAALGQSAAGAAAAAAPAATAGITTGQALAAGSLLGTGLSMAMKPSMPAMPKPAMSPEADGNRDRDRIRRMLAAGGRQRQVLGGANPTAATGAPKTLLGQ